MKVATTQPFKLVYSLTEHAHLGFLLEPHVVQLNSLGKLTLTHQRLFSATASDFGSEMDSDDLEIIALLDEIDQEHIVKKFNPKKDKIRPSDFFKKYGNDEKLFKEHIRPYIEVRLQKVWPRLAEKHKALFLSGKDKNPASKAIEIAREPSTVLFHFRKGEEGTRYFATIKYQGQRLDFMKKDARIICENPAWMLLDNLLLHFEGEVHGKKLAPFLNKHFIEIPKSAEPAYFSKFMVPLIERFDVYAEGFVIEQEMMKATPVLRLENAFNGVSCLVLSFKYGSNTFPYHSSKKVHVSLEEKDGQYVFRKIRRSAQWEENKREILEKMGLHYYDGSAFTLADRDHQPVTEAGQAESRYTLINWMNAHTDELNRLGYQVKQASEGIRYYLGKQVLNFQVTDHQDWFDVMATVTFGDMRIPFIRFRNHILQGKREFELPNGEIAIIPEEWFAKYAGIMEFSEDEDKLVLRKHHRSLLDELGAVSEEPILKADFVYNLEMVEEVCLPENFEGLLRPYQKQGYNWFYFLKKNGFGGCLADDMGLGKTIQTLALLQKEKENQERSEVLELKEEVQVMKEEPNLLRPAQLDIFGTFTAGNSFQPEEAQKKLKCSLIVVPTSLIYNWMNEAQKFTPGLRVYRYTGVNREKNIERFAEYDLILTTYGVVRNDVELFQQVDFHFIILDESQVIKNPLSQTARAIKSLKARHRLVLTGTPIENTLVDLWSQMAFANPGLLGNYTFFNEKFVQPIEKQKDASRMTMLQQLIRPFILRRTKQQVARDLPEKYEQVYYCEMTDEQEKLYENTKSFYRNTILKAITEFGLKKSQMTILKGLTELRQIANHPRLVNSSFMGDSGKFNELLRMIETALAEKHKVLVFSQFVRQLSLFREHFDAKGIRYNYIDGTVTAKKRMQQVDEFQAADDQRVFLISLKAGGTGLNLTAADYVFIVDPWWNPAIERQAIDRTHRIGQTRNVFSYKFISKGTVEEKILLLQQKKRTLAEEIISSDEQFFGNLDVSEIEEILN